MDLSPAGMLRSKIMPRIAALSIIMEFYSYTEQEAIEIYNKYVIPAHREYGIRFDMFVLLLKDH